MRQTTLRAATVAALLALAATAEAAPRSGAIVRAPEAVSAEFPAPPGVGSASTGLTDVLLGAFDSAAGAARPAAPAATGPPFADERPRASKPHQNPAFPAAFVFQSHSALFLAVNVARERDSAGPCGA